MIHRTILALVCMFTLMGLLCLGICFALCHLVKTLESRSIAQEYAQSIDYTMEMCYTWRDSDSK